LGSSFARALDARLGDALSASRKAGVTAIMRPSSRAARRVPIASRPLGDFAGTPLGVAGADRVRGGEAYA
jgi:hypothetical protein